MSLRRLSPSLLSAAAFLAFASAHLLVAQTAPFPLDAAAATPQAEVLLIGSYHMNNPAHDLHNTVADDVLTPQRQAEIEQLTAVLARFHPTKIAIEWDAGSQKSLDRLYDDYLAGRHQLTRDEREQVALRLARTLGLKKVYAIDTMWDFPYGSLINWAKANGRSSELERLDQMGNERSKADSAYLHSHSILEMYQRLNAPLYLATDAATYTRLGHFGDDMDPAGARLLTRWYERNSFILTSLLGITERNDRVLVLYGAGHQVLLRRFLADDPTLKLRTLDELTSH